MKTRLFPAAAVIMITAALYSQENLFLQEQVVDLPDGKSEAWVFPVARDLEVALNDLKEYAKDRGDLKMKKEGENMMIAQKVLMPAISAKRGDLIGYCTITEQYYGMALVFKLGYDISLNSKEWTTEMQNFRNYSKSFMSYHYEQVYARRLKEMEAQLKELEKTKSQNEGKIENMTEKVNNLGRKIGKETDTKAIDEYQIEINTLEADIRGLMDTLPGLDAQINDLKTRMEETKTESYAYQAAIGAF